MKLIPVGLEFCLIINKIVESCTNVSKPSCQREHAKLLHLYRCLNSTQTTVVLQFWSMQMFCDWTRLFFLRCKEDAWQRKIMQKNNSLSVSFWIWIKLNIWLNRLVCKDTDCIHDQDGNSDCRCILSCLATYTNINHFLLQFSKEWSDAFYSRSLKKKEIQENKTQASLVFNLLLKPELGCICWSYVLILAALFRKTDVTFWREERSASFKKFIPYTCIFNHVK